MASHGIKAEKIAPVGDPCAEILAAADEVAADVIVIGRRQKRHQHLRGVAAKLLRIAGRDLLIVNYTG